MGFLMNKTELGDSTGLGDGQGKICSVLLALGLMYLSIPNLMFLWGWYTPWVSVALSVFLCVVVGRAVGLCLTSSAGKCSYSWGRTGAFIGASLLSLLLLTLYFCQGGIVGCWDTITDLYVFRQALFCNLRDAAWPVILPNGREMTYYFANVLPPAALARVLPEYWHQWSVVLWCVPAIYLSLLLLTSVLPGKRLCWGARLLILTLVIICMRDFCRVVDVLEHATNLLAHAAASSGCSFTPDFGWLHSIEAGWLERGLLKNPLSECSQAWNSAPPTLLVASMLMVCRGKVGLAVAPLSMALLAALSPLGCIGLAPLAAVVYIGILSQQVRDFRWLDILFCFVMAGALAVYFLRAESNMMLRLTVQVWGMRRYGLFVLWQTLAWVLLLLPLCLIERRDMRLWVCALTLFFLPCVYFGTLPTAAWTLSVNELSHKTLMACSLLVGAWWVKDWSRIGWVKYLVVFICIYSAVLGAFSLANSFSRERYLRVDDKWNGHFLHEDGFLQRMTPDCREPMLPGVLLREAGASEKQFPGSLLPAAPGCDYTRPMTPREE